MRRSTIWIAWFVVLCLPFGAGASPVAPTSLAASASGFIANGADGPANALAIAARARGVPAPAVRAARLTASGLPSATAAFYETVMGIRLSAKTLHGVTRDLAPLDQNYKAGLATILASATTAQRLRTHAFALVAPEDIGFTDQIARRALDAPETVTAADTARALNVISRIDMASMVRAAAIVQSAAATAMPMFASAGAPDGPIETAYDAIVIGTAGSDVYTRDKQIVIDPAGDDTYENNAGGLLNQQAFDTSGGCVLGAGTTGRASPNLGCTPAPSQICTYDTLNNAVGTGSLPVVGLPNHDRPGTGQGRDGSCGNDDRRRALASHTSDIFTDGDSRGVAMVLDASGSDSYGVKWSHTDPLFELIDFCYPGDQSKTNTNRDLFQGGTLSGISLLWDAGPGNNTFRGRLNAQGSGHVGGVGMLFSTGGGNDFYWADRLSQGNGIAGGIGLLVDTGGTNTYLLEPPVVYRNEFRPNGRDCSQQGRAGQGEGGFLGVGVLWNGGAGTYRAVVHDTQEASPFAPVLGPDGAPALYPGSDAQGSGESFPIPNTPGGIVVGVGVLVDSGGDARTCLGSGKASGADNVTHSPGTFDGSCGAFNIAPEISAGDLGVALQHLGAGAVGLRVVLNQ